MHSPVLHHPTTMDTGVHKGVRTFMKNHCRHNGFRCESERVSDSGGKTKACRMNQGGWKDRQHQSACRCHCEEPLGDEAISAWSLRLPCTSSRTPIRDPDGRNPGFRRNDEETSTAHTDISGPDPRLLSPCGQNSVGVNPGGFIMSIRWSPTARTMMPFLDA